MMRKLGRKGQLVASVQALSSVAIAFFVFFIVIFATLKGMSSIRETIPADSVANNATLGNMSLLEGAAGQFAEFGDLIVIIAILAVIIALVSSAFVLGRR